LGLRAEYCTLTTCLAELIERVALGLFRVAGQSAARVARDDEVSPVAEFDEYSCGAVEAHVMVCCNQSGPLSCLGDPPRRVSRQQSATQCLPGLFCITCMSVASILAGRHYKRGPCCSETGTRAATASGRKYPLPSVCSPTRSTNPMPTAFTRLTDRTVSYTVAEVSKLHRLQRLFVGDQLNRHRRTDLDG
jgi:hypothetical protein